MFNLTSIMTLMPIITAGVQEAQGLFTKKGQGSDKKAHVMNLVKLSIEGTNQAAGHQVLNPDAALVAASHLVEGVVAAAKVKTHSEPTPPSGTPQN